MTVVLVHGNPETAAVWDPLAAALQWPDVIRLSPPGFGAPVRPGWVATPESYRGWLVRELEAIGRPVHLVGHDWGGAHVLGVAMTRPDLLLSWCVDTIGWFHPDYAWHRLARTLQTPGEGEAAAAAMTNPDAAQRTAYLHSLGIAESIARTVAREADRVDVASMLALYRSARQPALKRLGGRLEAAARRPGLAVLAEQDFGTGTDAARRAAARRAGAEVASLGAVGHWWLLEDPGRAATLMREFWARAEATSIAS